MDRSSWQELMVIPLLFNNGYNQIAKSCLVQVRLDTFRIIDLFNY
jgi:hypothetical protein